MKLFKKQTETSITNSTSAFMPGGRAFIAKGRDGSILRKFLQGVSKELFRIDEQMNLMSEDYDINAATQFIQQWESAVGIPDDCFDGTGTIEDRRKAVLAKLAKMNLTTEQDFIDLASFFGVSLTIASGTEASVFPMTFPIILFGTAKEAKFTMVVVFDTAIDGFPFTFPFVFTESANNLIQCLFNKLKPANVQIIYI
jgi:uncharacterized protein YmfQ (DUF2313 family)